MHLQMKASEVGKNFTSTPQTPQTNNAETLEQQIKEACLMATIAEMSLQPAFEAPDGEVIVIDPYLPYEVEALYQFHGIPSQVPMTNEAFLRLSMELEVEHYPEVLV